MKFIKFKIRFIPQFCDSVKKNSSYRKNSDFLNKNKILKILLLISKLFFFISYFLVKCRSGINLLMYSQKGWAKWTL
jgi:hypothetical protein